jgi:glycine betaine/proline transport system permease protein
MAVATLPSPAAPTFGTDTYRRYLVPGVVFVTLVVLALVANPDVPDWLDIGAQQWIRDRYLWTVEHRDDHWIFTWFFTPIGDFIDWAVEGMKSALSALRWPGVVALFGAIGWRTGGVRAACTAAAAVLGVAVLGVWDAAMVTLSLMLVAVVIALIIGVPLGIWTARSQRAERFLRSFLDTAQVLPAFVYLSPLVVLFGIKYPPAVVATVIYAVPPAVRLTNLGIRSVPEVTNEVAESFGCTPLQQLLKVQLPMARRTLLLGLNQVIMMAFGIVVIASILGTDDLGRLVLNGLQKNDVGAAFVPGLAIVLLAVALDRASTGERVASSRRPVLKLPEVTRRTGSLIAGGIVVASVAAAHLFGDGTFPSSLTVDLSGTVNDAVGWVQDNIRRGVPIIGGTQTINDFLVADILEPIRSFLVDVPWLLVVVAVALIAWLSKGWQLALGCAGCLVMIGTLGNIGQVSMWDLAMDTLSQVLVAIVISVVIAVPLGVLAGRSTVAETVMRPFLDIAQVMPQFVYLIPVIFLFDVGRGAGVVAAVVYAIPPCIRLTGLGLRDVPFTPREAAISFGATPQQELRKVQLPLAFRSIMLGINQTIMMVLATVVIAALVGAGALGLAAYEATTKPLIKIGSGTAAGLSIVFLAIVLDRITQAWGTGPQQREQR